jgi:ABC-2 type transport system ATP-binding protein
MDSPYAPAADRGGVKNMRAPNTDRHSDAPDTTRRDGAATDGIRVRGIVKRFGSHMALNGVNMDVAPGEVVAILGPNGAGKSTLLRILGTTVLPDEGSAMVGGYDVSTDASAVRRHIGVTLGDERSWYWRLSGRRNLEFFGAMYGLRRSAARDRARELLREVGLEAAGHRRFDGYSSGMRARLSLARALLMSPPVLLLDEPTRAIDPVAAADFRRRIHDLASRDRRVLLLATHDLYEAAAVADRVVVLSAGRIRAVRERGARPDELEAELLALGGTDR